MRLRWVLGHLHPVADPCAPTSCRGAGPMGPDSAALTVSYLVCRIERVVLTLGMTAQVLARDILVGFAPRRKGFHRRDYTCPGRQTGPARRPGWRAAPAKRPACRRSSRRAAAPTR